MIEQHVKDLTQLKFWDDNTLTEQTDNSRSVDNVKTSIYFRNQKQKLLELIENHDWIVGCVAWLTDFDLLRALSRKHVAIVVQKEDFLRPDSETPPYKWPASLQAAYAKLREFYRFELPKLRLLNYNGDTLTEAIRCMGNYNEDAESAFPRMHNKFLVFGTGGNSERAEYYNADDDDDVFPKFTSVWTGSCNLSKTSGQSLENAVLLESEKVAAAYYNEFAQIFTLSEPLNWQHVWCAPEYRIGT